MKPTDHCLLCDHRLLDIENGVLCGLINKRPNFTKTCETIKIEQNAKELNEKWKNKYSLHKSERSKAILHFIILTTVGIGALIVAYVIPADTPLIYHKHGIPNYFVPIMLITLGCWCILRAIGRLAENLNEIKLAKAKLSRINTVLKIYAVENKFK